MRVFKTRWFNKWAKKEKLPDSALLKAVEEMKRGLIDADLGGHVYKKRVALPGRGKSGSLRTIIAYQVEDSAFYVYGFAKNTRANIREDELKAFKIVAENLLSHSDKQLDQLLNVEELVEVEIDE